MLKKSDTRKKLFIGFGGAVALVILIVLVSSISINKYSNAVELVFYSNQLDSILDQEIAEVWRFMAGDEKRAIKHKTTHSAILEIKEELGKKKGKRSERLLSFIEQEQSHDFDSFFHGEDGFFEKITEAREGFIDKNNKHVTYLLGYSKNWVERPSKKEEKVFEILDLIRNERILFEEFNPRSSDASDKIEEFRKVNDGAVEGLVELWKKEINIGREKTTSSDFKKKLLALKNVVGQITATSFPSVSQEQALLLNIEANENVLFGINADTATTSLYSSFKEILNEYEQNEGMSLWLRADVPKVGEKVTPIFTLGKVVSCQQGLRVNAEDIFRLQTAFVNDVEPELILIKGNIEKLHEEISAYVENLALAIQVIIITISLLTVFLIVLLELFVANVLSVTADSRGIRRPISSRNPLKIKFVTIFIVSFFIVGLISGIIVGGYSYYEAENILLEITNDNLKGISASYTEHIKTFLEAKKGRAIDFSSDGFIKNRLKDIKENPSEETMNILNGHLITNKIILDPGLYEIFVLDANGKIVGTTNPEEEFGEDFSNSEFFLEAKDKTYLSDIFYDEEFKRWGLVASAPIINEDNFLGVVVLRIIPEKISEITTDRTGLGETGEVYIVDKDSLLITPSRFLSGDGKGIYIQKVETENSKKCLWDIEQSLLDNEFNHYENEPIIFDDYRGISVLGAHDIIIEMNWCVLAEISEAEGIGIPRNKFIILNLFVSLFLIAFLTFVGFFFGRYLDKKSFARGK